MRFFLSVVINALALATAGWMFDGIRIDTTSTNDRILTMLAVGLIFGLINATVAPLVKLLSLPFIILTLGLLLLVINALMLMLTSTIAGWFDLGFVVDGFGTAFLGAIVISLVSWFLGLVLSD